MKAIFAITLFIAVSLAYSQDDLKHMVILSTSGVGASGAYEKMAPDNKSIFDRYDLKLLNLELNYHYTIRPQLQIGGFLLNNTEDRNYKTAAGKKTGRIDYHTTYLGVDAIWNFSPDLTQAWYIGFAFSYLNHEEEYSHNQFNFLEDDRNSFTHEIFFGKRFSLKKWGIQNITYSPGLSVFASKNSKDYADDGLEHSMGVVVQMIKFDVLF